MSRYLLLHNDTRELPRLMSFVEALCREWGVEEELMSLQLAMEESVVNIMHYAFTPDADGVIEVRAERVGDCLTFYIEDCGVAFDPTAVPDADVKLSAEEREIGGLGIYIVRQIMDEVEYRRCDERNILRLTKIIKS